MAGISRYFLEHAETGILFRLLSLKKKAGKIFQKFEFLNSQDVLQILTQNPPPYKR